MTDMKRVTISIPNEIDAKIIQLRKTDKRFERSSYSEIARYLFSMGIRANDSKRA